VLLLVPFVLLIVGLRTLTEKYGVKLTISYYLGIAIGPLIADLFAVVSTIERRKMRRAGVSTFSLAPDVKAWAGYFPNPLRVLDRQQTMWTMVTAAVSSATFVFSPIAMTVILGELVGARIKHSYERLTTVIAVRNGVTEATFIAEVIIPLMAFGLPLSPIAAGPAAALFNAPPRFSADAATGHINNLHTLMSGWEFLGYGLLSVFLAALIPACDELRPSGCIVRCASIEPRSDYRSVRGTHRRNWNLGRASAWPARHSDDGTFWRVAFEVIRLQYRGSVHGLLRCDIDRTCTRGVIPINGETHLKAGRTGPAARHAPHY